MSRRSRPEIQNAVQKLARQGSARVTADIKALRQAMDFRGATSSRGWTIKIERE